MRVDGRQNAYRVAASITNVYPGPPIPQPAVPGQSYTEPMHAAATLLAAFTILAVLWESFETVILPRRIQRKLRFTRFFYLFTWKPWKAIALRIQNPTRRETMLSFFGPLSLILLFATWALVLTLSFGLLQWGLGSGLKSGTGEQMTLATDIYMSGTTLFTLGLGDIAPYTPAARFVAVVECALGFGLIALVISYLPTMYQSFARREVNISLLDARAGSPPTASEFLRRFGLHGGTASAGGYLAECERWASEVLESHMSYPALCYFRSQHANQSWISALTTVMDICVLIELSGPPEQRWQAELTFAMARHAVVDLMQVFHLKVSQSAPDRLPPQSLAKLRENVTLPEDDGPMRRLRAQYEPFVHVLSEFLAMELAPWVPAPHAHDNWSTKTVHF
jgi:hypothetical protein